MSVFIINYAIKKITRSEHSPLARIVLFFISAIAQACSPFSGPVDKSVSDSYYYSKSGDDICYSPMGNWFELGNKKLNVDAKSFQVIARDFGKDKNHLYFKKHIIDKEVDRASFKVADKNYFCFDKEKVYVAFNYLPLEFSSLRKNDSHLFVVEKANPKTFKKIDFSWSKDDKRYFYYYKSVDVDYGTFEILNGTFAKDKDQVYLLKIFELLPSPSIDAASTRALNDRYIADKDNVYDFQEYEVRKNEPAKVVDSLVHFSHTGLSDLKFLGNKYLLFDQKVVFDGFEIDGADAGSFEVVKPPYAKDKHRVYYYGKVIEGADPNTIQVFEYLIYSKDKDHVFANGKILKEADVKTFGPPKEKFSLLYKDKNHTYRGDEIVEE